MKSNLLENLGIRAADDSSAINLARLAAGEVQTGLVIFTGPPESKARHAAVTLAFSPALAAEELADAVPCFSSGTVPASGVPVEVIDLAAYTEDMADDLAESVSAAVAQGSPKLLFIVERGEPVEIPAEAEAVALRVRLAPAAELQAAS